MPKSDKPKNRRLSAVPSPADQGILGKGGKCNSLKRNSKDRCTLPAGQGTEHLGYGACQYHGGNSPSLKKNAVKALLRDMAAELDMDPHDALLFTVRLAAGTVAWLRVRIEEIGELTDDMSTSERAAHMDMVRMLSDMYGEERDRLTKTAKLAIDAGIDERRISLEEEQGELIAKAVTGILADLGLTPQQKRDAPAIARKHLALLAQTG